MQMIRLPARAANLSYGSDAGGLNRLDDRLCADALQAARRPAPAAVHLAGPLPEPRAGRRIDLGRLRRAGRPGGRRRPGAPKRCWPHCRRPSRQALSRLLPRLVTVAGDDAVAHRPLGQQRPSLTDGRRARAGRRPGRSAAAGGRPVARRRNRRARGPRSPAAPLAPRHGLDRAAPRDLAARGRTAALGAALDGWRAARQGAAAAARRPAVAVRAAPCWQAPHLFGADEHDYVAPLAGAPAAAPGGAGAWPPPMALSPGRRPPRLRGAQRPAGTDGRERELQSRAWPPSCWATWPISCARSASSACWAASASRA